MKTSATSCRPGSPCGRSISRFLLCVSVAQALSYQPSRNAETFEAFACRPRSCLSASYPVIVPPAKVVTPSYSRTLAVRGEVWFSRRGRQFRRTHSVYDARSGRSENNLLPLGLVHLLAHGDISTSPSATKEVRRSSEDYSGAEGWEGNLLGRRSSLELRRNDSVTLTVMSSLDVER